MKKTITIAEVGDLKAAVGKLGGVISAQPLMPVLGNVLVHVTAQGVVLIGTNLEHTVAITVPVLNEDALDYKYLLPYKLLSDYLGKCTAPGVSIAVEERKVKGVTVEAAVLTAGDDVIHIPSLASSTDWPAESVLDNQSIGMADDMMKWIVALGAITRKPDVSGNKSLEHVFVKIDEEVTTLVATNTFVLVEKTFAVPASRIGELLISRGTVKLLKGITEVTMFFNKTFVRFAGKGITVTSKLFDSGYAAYKSVIPETTPAIRLRTSALKNAIDKVSLTGTPAKITPYALTLNFASRNDEYDMKTDVAAELINDQAPAAFRIQPNKLADVLDLVNYETMNIGLASPQAQRPIILTSDSDDSFLGLCTVMGE